MSKRKPKFKIGDVLINLYTSESFTITSIGYKALGSYLIYYFDSGDWNYCDTFDRNKNFKLDINSYIKSL